MVSIVVNSYMQEYGRVQSYTLLQKKIIEFPVSHDSKRLAGLFFTLYGQAPYLKVT